jgi:4-hydroxy-tetrahydrodipicolinate synthase
VAIPSQTLPVRTKAWARDFFRGVEGCVLPSFVPGFADIDEAGIRHDVRLGIAQGYFSLFCSSPATAGDEYLRFITAACDEADGRIGISIVAGSDSVERNLALLAHAAAVGCTHALVAVRPVPDTAAELLADYRRLIRSTPLGIVLYAYRSPALRRFDPTGIPLDVLSALADEPNVVAVKLTQTLDPTTALVCAERLGDRLLVGSADLAMLSVLAGRVPITWTGQWLTDALQSPDRRYLVEFMTLLRDGRLDDAHAFYWTIEPAYRAFAELQRPFLLRSAHPWTHMKYYQWCVGGNGGLLRPNIEGTGPISDADREAIRESYRNLGIAVSSDDGTFDAGRVRS